MKREYDDEALQTFVCGVMGVVIAPIVFVAGAMMGSGLFAFGVGGAVLAVSIACLIGAYVAKSGELDDVTYIQSNRTARKRNIIAFEEWFTKEVA